MSAPVSPLNRALAALAFAGMFLTSGPVSAVDFYWDPDLNATGDNVNGAGLGGAGTWDSSTSNWWSGTGLVPWTNALTDNAIFTYEFPSSPYAVPVNNAVTVDAGGVSANRITFQRSGYTLSGGAITLGGTNPGLYAVTGEAATITSNLLGAGGLTKTGAGSIRLSGDNTGLTGSLTIAGGTLVVNSANAIPGSGNIIVSAGNGVPSNVNLNGFTGGQLLLDGSAGGFTVSRNLNIEGRGAGGNSAALISLGNNTLSGTVSTLSSTQSPTTLRNTRITSLNGMLTLSGTLSVPGAAGTNFLVLGGGNTAGSGSYNLTGVLSGAGTLEKSGAGTLLLNPSSTSGFTGAIRISGSATGQQSTVRVTQLTVGSTSVFGANTGTGTSGVIDLNGGVLEFRSDSSLNFNALASGKNIYNRVAGSIFTGPALGGSAINRTVTLGALQHVVSTTASTATTTFTSRNGYAVTLPSVTVDASTSTSILTNTLTNNMGGDLTITGNITLGEGNTASRPRILSIGGTGNTVVQGNLIAGTDPNKDLTKSGAGNLTLVGTGNTLAGFINITAGAITATDFRSLNNNSSPISLGNGSTTGGNLIIGNTGGTATGVGLTTSKVINLNTTTATNSIYASQSIASPVVFSSDFVSTGVGAKTLILGGTSTQDNAINGAIRNGGMAFTPSALLAAGGTTISFTDTTGMAIGQYVTGVGIQTGTTISAITPTSITLSRPTTADRVATDVVNASTGGGAAVGVTKVGPGTWVLGGANTFTGATTIQNGRLKLLATSGTSDVVGSTGTVTFSADAVTQSAGGTLEFRGFLNTATTEALGALTPSAGIVKIVTTANGTGSAALTFASLGTRAGGAHVDYQPGASTTIGFTTLPTVSDGILGAAAATAFQTYNGVDWATLSGSNVAQYTGYTVNTLPASGTTGQNTNYNITANQATTAAATINSLKITGGAGNPTLTLGGVLTIDVRAILFDNSAGVGTITGSTINAAVENHIITNGSSVSNGGVAGAALTLGNALTISSLIGSGTGAFTKSGTGSLIVTGNNTFTGNVVINEGIVQLSGATATLGVNSTAANTTTIRQGATLDINAAGVSQTTGILGLNGAGVITNSGGGTNTAATISIGRSTSTGAGIFSGVLQDGVSGGVLNVTVDGTTRAQAFLGDNTYTGVTTIATSAQLTVDVLEDGGVTSGIGASSNAASNLIFNGTAPTLIYRGNTRNGSLNLGSASTSTDRLFTISGAGAVISSTATNNNAIIWSNTGDIVHGNNADRTLTLTGTSTGDNTFNPRLTNSTGFVSSLTKSGTGQWNLNATNTYTGATSIQDGVLALNNTAALPTNSPVVLGSGTTSGVLQMSGTFARDLATAATAGTGTVTWGGTTGGGGFSAHTSQLTVTLNSGAGLTWGSGGFVGTGGTQTLAFNSTSALSDVVFTNPINLNGGVRSVSVTDNTSTATDYATLSGVISGGAGTGLTKTGNGILRLGSANTYEGATQVSSGTLMVSKLGRSTDAPGTGTSVGLSGVAMVDANAIALGAGGNNAGILVYTGAGEISDRKIRLNSTTGTSSTNQIHADGSGPLILTNLANDMAAGAKSIVLRGSSTAGNMITSQLIDNGGALSVTIDGNATWILTNGANSYTGNTAANGGALGIGHNTAIPGTLSISNGNVFAHGADRSVSNTLTLGNNATSGFFGDYSLTFTGTNNLGAGANNLNLLQQHRFRKGAHLQRACRQLPYRQPSLGD